MVVAVLLGVLAGIAAFLPLLWCLKARRKVTQTSNLGYAGVLMLGLGGSILILFGAAVACIVLARDLLLPFAGGEAGALVVFTLAFAVYKIVRDKQEG